MSSLSNIDISDGIKNINQWQRYKRKQEKEGTKTQREI
jgi:hypothetical protein